MTDSVVNYYYAWTDYFASVVPTDSVFIVTVAVYIAAFLGLLAFKITSYDADIYYASKNVLRYLNDKSKVKKGSLNFYMRGMPKKVYTAWEKYCLEKEGKPSSYLTRDLSCSFGALDNALTCAYKFILFIGTLINLLFALCNSKLAVVEALFLPALTAVVGAVLVAITGIIFAVFKRNADKKFTDVVKALDVYEAHAVVPKMFTAPSASAQLAESLDKILSDCPETILVKDGKSE